MTGGSGALRLSGCEVQECLGAFVQGVESEENWDNIPLVVLAVARVILETVMSVLV